MLALVGLAVVGAAAVPGCGSDGTLSYSAGAGDAGAGGAEPSEAGSGANPVCAPGDTRDCVGPGRCEGAQECGANGTWASCDCSGSSGSAGGDAGNAGAASGTAGSSGASGSGGAGGASGSGSDTGGTAGDGGMSGVGGNAAAGGSSGTGSAAGVSGSSGAGGTGGNSESGGASGSGGTSGSAGAAATGGSSGVGAAGGQGGTGGGGPTYDVPGQSCFDLTGTECNGTSCCTSIALPAGSYLMGRSTEDCDGCTDGCPSGMSCYDDREQPEHPATVSSFALDIFEVTVGRFRAFVAAYDGTAPPPGAGAHPLIAGSGWDSTWDNKLPADRAGLIAGVKCESTSQTWTDEAGANEAYPMNCVNWYEAFAFCIWDGGRLPTEAEWEYAAAGGSENRVYPWGDDVTEPLPADYEGTDNSPFVTVGSYPAGNGRWGHADLAGSMWEWMLDWYASDWHTTIQSGCVDCANLTASSHRAGRGNRWDSDASSVRAAFRGYGAPASRYEGVGLRCARTP